MKSLICIIILSISLFSEVIELNEHNVIVGVDTETYQKTECKKTIYYPKSKKSDIERVSTIMGGSSISNSVLSVLNPITDMLNSISGKKVEKKSNEGYEKCEKHNYVENKDAIKGYENCGVYKSSRYCIKSKEIIYRYEIEKMTKKD